MNQKLLIELLQKINTKGGIDSLTKLEEEALSALDFKPYSCMEVYRGLAFESWADFHEKTSISHKVAKNDQVEINCGIHWTNDLEVALDFCNYPGRPIRMVISAIIDPEDVIVDTNLIPDKIRNKLEYNDESEIIINKILKSRIVYLLEWEEKEIDLD